MRFTGLVFLFVASVAFATEPRKAVLNCEAYLSGSGIDSFKLSSKSEEFEPTIFGLSGAQTSVELGDYTLSAKVNFAAIGPFEAGATEPLTVELEPVLHVSLSNANEPVSSSSTSGLALESRPAGVPLRVHGTSRIQAEVEGKKVSRVDYRCELTVLK